MAALQIQDPGAPEVTVTSKGRTGGSHGRAAPPTDEPVLVRGNLQKHGKRFKGWHQRYFEIQGSHMYYYKNATKKDCLGEINLAICYYCEPTTAASFGSPFELRTVQRSHILATRSKEEMQQWIQVIKQQMSPTESEAKKGGTNKKSAKPRRWESFKNTFAVKRSPSPAVEPREQKKVTKKSFMDRFKVKRGVQRTASTSPKKSRPLSFTGADEKYKDTLDVFAQVDVSKSLPASPVAKRKKQSVASFETATPISPMSLTSGSIFTPGGMTSDSQTSTPIHVARAGSTQREVEANSPSEKKTVGQEVQVRVDVEDTSTVVIPVIVEPGDEEEKVEESHDVSKPADEPVKPDIIVKQEPERVESPTEPVESAKPVVVVVEKESDTVKSPTEPAEPDKPVEPVVAVEKVEESVPESPSKPVESVKEPEEIVTEGLTKPAEPVTVVEKEEETVSESPTIPVEPVETVAVAVNKESESPTKPVEPVEPVTTSEKETEVVSGPPEPESPVKPDEPVKSDEPAAVLTKKEDDNVQLPTEPVNAVEEGEAEKKVEEKPTISVEPAPVMENEEDKKPKKKPALPVKPAAATQKIEEKEPFVPKYLNDTKFQWDKIREILETTPASAETDYYSELPPQEVNWTDHTSSVEQLRAFLQVCH